MSLKEALWVVEQGAAVDDCDVSVVDPRWRLTSTCFQAVCLAGASAAIPTNTRRLASQRAAGYLGKCISCLYLYHWDER